LTCFALLVPLGYISFKYIEEAFLGLRHAYLKETLQTRYTNRQPASTVVTDHISEK
jgi:hypothetical protein